MIISQKSLVSIAAAAPHRTGDKANIKFLMKSLRNPLHTLLSKVTYMATQCNYIQYYLCKNVICHTPDSYIMRPFHRLPH